MKKLLLLLLCVPLIFSCGESSTKGKWSTSDLEKCKSEFKKGALQGEDESGQNIIDMYGKTAEEITSCMCEQLMITYSSWSESKRLLPTLSEEESSEIMGSCLSTEESSKKGDWSSTELAQCKSSLREVARVRLTNGKTEEEITSCMCEQLMIMYSSLDEAQYQLSEKGLDEMLDSCLSINISLD